MECKQDFWLETVDKLLDTKIQLKFKATKILADVVQIVGMCFMTNVLPSVNYYPLSIIHAIITLEVLSNILTVYLAARKSIHGARAARPRGFP